MIRAAVLAACLPGAALALTDADCQASRDLMLGGVGLSLSAGAGQAVGDWCHVPQVAWGGGAYGPTFAADLLRYRIAGDPGLPLRLEVSLAGLRQGVNIPDDPLMTWLLAHQSGPEGMAVDLSLSRDPAAQTLTVERFNIDFPGPSAVSLTLTVGDIDLPALADDTAQAMAVTLRAMDLRVVTEGLFERYALMPLGQVLLAGSADPAADLGRLQAQGRALVEGLPDGLMDAPARAALVALIDDMPHPRGTVALQVDAAAGLPLSDLLALAEAPALPAWQGVTLRLSYTRHTPEP